MLDLVPNPISDIIQGGVLGLAVLMVWVGYRMFCSMNILLTNHLVHILEVLTGVGEKLDRLVGTLETSNRDALLTARAAAKAAEKVATAAQKAAKIAHNVPRHD